MKTNHYLLGHLPAFATLRRETRLFTGQLLREGLFTLAIFLMGFAMGAIWMWRDTAIQCGTMHQHFVPWSGEAGFTCSYETRYKTKGDYNTLPKLYEL